MRLPVMRVMTKVIAASMIVAIPLTWLAFAAIYMPQPLAFIGRLILAPLLLLDMVASDDPAAQASGAVLWSAMLALQAVWFSVLGCLVFLLFRWLSQRSGRQ
jgi:hypothetical protein